MPYTPSEVIENLKEINRELGGNDGPPAGSHQTRIMKRDAHPAARYDKATGLPELFFIAQISEGQFERRTIPVTLKWFAPDMKSDYAGGGERTDEEKASLAGMYRSNALDFFKGMWGKDLSRLPVSIPSKDDSPDVVYEVFRDIAGVIGELDVRCEVGYRVKDGVPSDFPNFKWTEIKSTGFSLAAD